MLRLISRPTTITRQFPVFSRTLASITVPETQKAIVIDKHGGELQYKDIPVPKPKSGEILVNVKYTGVCNSDLHLWKGDWGFEGLMPLILGHEGAGVVVAKGPDVTNFEIGDLAGIKWLNSTCKTCEFCENSYESNCPTQTNSGFSAQGTYQQYAIADAIQAARIPEGVDLAKVAPLLCAGVTVYKALKEANIRAGDWITIIGAGGGLGSLAVQYARALGFKIIGVDNSSKRDFALDKGVTEFVAFDEVKNIPEHILELTKGGSHAVLNVSNSVQAYNDATTYVRPRGTVLVVGLPGGKNPKIESHIVSHALRCINIKGSCVGNRADTREALQFFKDGLIESNVKVVGLSQAAEVFKLMEQGGIFGRYVLDTSK